MADGDEGPPPQLVQALGALLRSAGSQMDRQTVRAEARSAVTNFVRRRRAQGERADLVLALVRSAWRRANSVQAGTIDHLSAPWRALREEVMQWAMRADAPEGGSRREYPAYSESRASL